MKTNGFARLAACLGMMTFIAGAQTLDTKPAYMQIVTNFTYETKLVIVTNQVVSTNAVVVTNLYNAGGQLLQPVPVAKPAIPGLIPIPQPQPAAPDPAVVKANQLQAIRDLLTCGLLASSNNICATGSFAGNAAQQIPIPQGVTSFDRNKTQALLSAMNLTAEKAALAALPLLLKSAAQFQTDDPAALLQGSSDAATRAFLTETWQTQLLPLVRQAGEENGLRQAYNNVMLKGGGLLGSFLGTGPTVDIESHVTQGLLRAITGQLAAQESVIRSDANARKTTALRQAFQK